jgi:hypothetical protein
MDVVPLFRGRCLETNDVSESLASNVCFSGSSILLWANKPHYLQTFWLTGVLMLLFAWAPKY